MHRHIAPLIALLACGVCAAAGHEYQVTDRGVIIALADGASARHLRLEATTPSAIRCTATMNDTFATTPSLMAIPTPVPPFTVTATDNSVTLTTTHAQAICYLPEGRVEYRGNGRLKLAEAVGGRHFTPIEVEGTQGWTVRQVFQNLNDSEGLYGLGQHQADEFDYKGRNEELFQYNTKVSVPMVVSSDGYGVLWDSYSLCRFGNPDDYRQLGDLFTLYDADGQPGALTGTYTQADGTQMTRREPSLYFEHLIRGDLDHVINLPQDFDFYGSKVVYEGEIEAPATGLYPFILYYSGYQTLYLDGQQVVPQRWRTAWNPNSYKFTARLEKGRRTHIRLEWEPNGSVAYCGLRAYPAIDARQRQMSWWGEMQDEIDYYFINGNDADGVVAGYRAITGRAPIMPKWAMGYWQSREKYNTQAEVLGTLAEFRRRQIPIDNIVIDWLHWPQDAWGSHEFDAERFPLPAAMVDSIHAMHGRVMISVWPKFYATTQHFREFDSQGWMYRQAIADSIRDWVGPGYLGSFYDAYHPAARRLFWQQIADHYLPLGFDAWWMDASEPNIRDCTDMQYRKDLCGPTALGPSTKYFNAYALVNAEAIYHGQRGLKPDQRVFLLTRSGFAGLQRYSTATWSGDIATRWEDMKAQISAGLNFSISGIPWWSMDIGGFCVEDRYVAAAQQFMETGTATADLDEWRELNARWHQFGAFAPMYRSHGQWPYREPWNIAPVGHPAYETIVYYNRLRYALLPYIYSLAAMTHFDDYTIMRPLVMDFAHDATARAIGDQYMFGPAFLAAPVYEYQARQRQVYLPAGTRWYDFYTGTCHPGGAAIVAPAPLERMPLYVRAGSIVPVGPDIQYTSQAAADPVTVYVYAGADGRFTLYDDQGETYGYERGEYAKIPFAYDDTKRLLTIGARQGSYPGMPGSRTFKIVVVDADTPVAYGSEAPSATTVCYDGQAVSLRL